jgi:hypothetical protein
MQQDSEVFESRGIKRPNESRSLPRRKKKKLLEKSLDSHATVTKIGDGVGGQFALFLCVPAVASGSQT